MVQKHANTPPEPELRSSSPVDLTGLVHPQPSPKQKKRGHDLKEKMAQSTNLTSILTHSKYIESYEELNFKVCQLSCFDLSSKNSIFLPTLVGLQTTKDPRELRENRREKNSGKYLQCCAELVLPYFSSYLILLMELTEVYYEWYKDLDP